HFTTKPQRHKDNKPQRHRDTERDPQMTQIPLIYIKHHTTHMTTRPTANGVVHIVISLLTNLFDGGLIMRFPILTALMVALSLSAVSAQTLENIKLPAPALTPDKPLMQALKERQSRREYTDKPLTSQDLSNILWCANGVNRPESGKRTSPSAKNAQDIDIYAIMKDGVYLYDAPKHELALIASGDHKLAAGTQPYVASAPLNLIYVSDLSKFDFMKEREDQLVAASVDAGHCSQNVYLYGAAANLAVVTRMSVPKEKAAEVLKLRPQQYIVIGQTIGYPK
ncbi:MAG TPA: SagB/ThcOx family dehydrogenase, partial [Candidatus Ozemobacteraceae bacterium]|nr:SagB/ThcOx family dehydrogenase [Candidatus Ozemobacteraceae bacterium]